MPSLPVDGRGVGAQILPETLWAVMAFPRDSAKRHSFLARFWELETATLEASLRDEPGMQPRELSRVLGEWFGARLEDVGGFSILGNAPALPELQERLYGSIWPGQAAGDILINLLQLEVSGVGASVNKAVALTIGLLRSGVTKKSGEPGAGKSERYIRKAWEEFKPACHLWAAFGWWRDQEFDAGPFEIETADQLLMVAEAFLRMASALQSRGRRETVLNAEEMWRVPRRYPLPRLKHFEVPPLTDAQLEILSSYKAPKRD